MGPVVRRDLINQHRDQGRDCPMGPADRQDLINYNSGIRVGIVPWDLQTDRIFLTNIHKDTFI
jgi:hypothetical protein